MILEILPLALEEIEQAFLFYESERKGLGHSFFDEVEESYDHILSNPKAWTILDPSSKIFRRCMLHRFPFALIYVIEKEKLVVVAAMHLARKPGYWRKRKNKTS